MEAEREEAPEVEVSPLPKGWALVKLAEIVERLTDGTHQPPKFERDGVPFIVIGNIKNQAIDWTAVTKWVSRETYETEAKRLRPRKGDILYTAVGSYGIAVHVADDRDFMFQRHIAFLRPRQEIVDPIYLCHALNSPALKHQANKAARGVAQKTVTLGSLRDFVLLLAPLSEQRRIVAQIDGLFAEIAEGEAALEGAHSGLDSWRRSLLKAATMGELTRDWREANRPSETGADLLVALANDPRKSGARRTRALEPVRDDFAPSEELPSTWTWARLSDLSFASSYGTSVKCAYEAAGHPVLRIPNVRNGRIDLSDLKRATESLDIEKHDLVSPGDLLVVRTNGSEDLIGRGTVVIDRIETDAYFASYLIRFRLLGDNMLWRWVGFVFDSPMVRQWMTKHIASSAGQYNVSQASLAQLSIPLPPHAELLELVQRLSNRLMSAEDTEGDIDREASSGSALRQSILKTAFEGRLVPQDPNDEPASVLLARLRAESPSLAPRRARGRKAAS
jgi:type I restriction enzyme, S subunit